MNLNHERILVTGATGLIGRNLCNRFEEYDYDYIGVGHTRGFFQYNLLSEIETRNMFDVFSPSVVIHLAAKVGGIYANSTKKAQFYLENTLINTNVMREVQKRKIKYVFAMGTGCAYPKRLEGSLLSENSFLDGVPEVTNDAYAYAKRNLLVHLQACKEQYKLKYCYGIPANIYGPFDNFHPTDSHVVPALLRKFIEAVGINAHKVFVWGDGFASRDFLYIEDLIDAMLLIIQNDFEGAVNIATGKSYSIFQLAELIKKITHYQGEIKYDDSYPNGQKERIFDTSKIKSLNWSAKHTLEQGLQKTIDWYCTSGKD